MHFRAIALISSAMSILFVLTACGGNSRSYPTNQDDSKYNLKDMALSIDDVPNGLNEFQLETNEFDNEAWASIFGGDDPAAKQKALDAQGRLKSYVAVFSADQAAKVVGVTSISTLYTNETSARDAQSKYACGAPVDDATPLTDMYVPKIGDQSSGFLIETDQGTGVTAVQTTVCFRTGRVMNVVQESSIPGVTDVALTVQMAQKMLQHVNDSFDGKPRPAPVKTPIPTEAPADTGTAPGGSTNPSGTAVPGGTAIGGTTSGTAPAGSATPPPATTPAP
jgi:hypothetical protein